MKLRLRLGVLLSAIVTLSTAGVALSSAPAVAATEIGPLQVINYNSGLCIDIEDRSTADGAEIHQWTCRRESHQLWHFRYQPTGGYFMMIPHHTYTRVEPGCLTIPNWSKVSGADAKLYECTAPPWANSSQGFSLVQSAPSALPTPGSQNRYRFVNWFSNMCLEIAGGSTSLGAVVQQATCDGSAKQLWIVVP